MPYGKYWRGLPVSRKDLSLGVLAGAANIAVAATLLMALDRLPTAVVFPTRGCLVIVLNLTHRQLEFASEQSSLWAAQLDRRRRRFLVR